ncbi:MAG TPA: AEC family transporter [Steroidobacteraceae bacterium]|jgi:hypothetical protein
MSALLLLFVCLALGILVAYVFAPPAGMAASLNWWVINIALPALVLNLVPRLQFQSQFWFLAAANWVVFAGSALLFAGLGRVYGWSRSRIGALILVGGLGNTAFMGYPMIEAMRGPQGLSLAVVGDQTGCFTALVIGGMAVTVIYAGRELSAREVLKQIARFPPFLALLIGLALGRAGDPFPLLHEVCGRIAATLSPLALFSVGLQQTLTIPRAKLPVIGCSLVWKLGIAPALCYLVARATGVGGLVLVVGVLQAAMPPMVSAAILAERYRLEPDLANAVLGIAILLSLVTVPWINALL